MKSLLKAQMIITLFLFKLTSPYCLILAYVENQVHDDICLVFSKGKFDLNNNYVHSLDIDHGIDCNVGAVCSIIGWGTTYVRT